MADDATFRVVLDDQISGPAETAAGRMERLKSSIERGRKELSALQKSMRDMKRSGSVSAEVMETHQKRIDELKRRLGDANAEFLELGGTFAKTKTGKQGKDTNALKDALSDLGVKTGGVSERFSRLGKFFKSSAGRAVLMKAAVIAVAAAVIALAAAMTKYGIAQSNVAREERLRFEAMAHLRGRSRSAIADAQGMQDAIEGVAAKTGAARSELAGYAEAAYRAGLRGKALEEAVRGAAVRGAALGERYGKSFVFMAASAARAGQDIGKMADDAQERYGGLASRRLMSLGNLSRRFGENLASLFSGVDIEPLLKSLSRFVDLFTRANEVGRETKGWVDPFVGGMVRGLASVVDATTWFVEAWTLGWLKTQNVIKSGVSASIDILFWLEDRLKDFKSFFADIKLPSWVEKAADIAQGLAGGLKKQHGLAGRAGGGLADAVAKGFRDRAQIKSPSKLFASFGDDVSAGFAIGVERSAPKAHEAIGGLVEFPSFPATQTPESGSGVALGGVTVSISFGDVITQATDAEGVLESLRLKIGEVLEGAVVQAGLA